MCRVLSWLLIIHTFRSKSWPQPLTLNCCSELWFISLFISLFTCLIGQASIHSHWSYVKNNCTYCSVHSYKVKSMSQLLWRFSEVIDLFNWTKQKKRHNYCNYCIFPFSQHICIYECPFKCITIIYSFCVIF